MKWFQSGFQSLVQRNGKPVLSNVPYVPINLRHTLGYVERKVQMNQFFDFSVSFEGFDNPLIWIVTALLDDPVLESFRLVSNTLSKLWSVCYLCSQGIWPVRWPASGYVIATAQPSNFMFSVEARSSLDNRCEWLSAWSDSDLVGTSS